MYLSPIVFLLSPFQSTKEKDKSEWIAQEDSDASVTTFDCWSCLGLKTTVTHVLQSCVYLQKLF